MALDGPLVPLLVLATSCGGFLLRRRFNRSNPVADVAVMLVIVSMAMFLEWRMGRNPTYEHGPVRLWSGDINSDQNSQQIFDPYSFTHVIHGAVFYGLTRLLLRTAPFVTAATVVVTLEAAWESYENTNQVIDRYRAETVSLGYRGDSMINSLSDIVCCVIGIARQTLARMGDRLVGGHCGNRAGALDPRQSHTEHHHADPSRTGDQSLADGRMSDRPSGSAWWGYRHRRGGCSVLHVARS
jgi:hypothetical protein